VREDHGKRHHQTGFSARRYDRILKVARTEAGGHKDLAPAISTCNRISGISGNIAYRVRTGNTIDLTLTVMHWNFARRDRTLSEIAEAAVGEDAG